MAARAAVTALALTCVGVGLLLSSAPVASGAASAPPVAPAPNTSPSAAAKADRSVAPSGDLLVIPALSVQAPLVSVTMSPERVLTPPRDAREVGYWDASAPPGSSSGQTVVTGHTVHTGGGALDRLGTLQPGRRVTVYRGLGGGRVAAAYRVTTVRVYGFAELARRAQQLFGQTHGGGQLVLVTCTGWDGRRYHGNVVVTATPLGAA